MRQDRKVLSCLFFIKINGIYNKNLIIDVEIIVESSFNWRLAVHNKYSSYCRLEKSIIIKGEDAKEIIKVAKKELEIK